MSPLDAMALVDVCLISQNGWLQKSGVLAAHAVLSVRSIIYKQIVLDLCALTSLGCYIPNPNLL